MPGERRDAVVVERILDAPVEQVWRMWTQPEDFTRWYGPDGATIHVIEMDLTVGGTRLVRMDMETPGGPRQMWFTGEHVEVVVGQRLVYTEAMADGHGNLLAPSAMGMPGDDPEITEVTVELEDLGGRTRMVMTHAGVPPDSPGASGWTMAFEKLDRQLADGPS
jgi:uncharacterized protein YndB with AHSA1/START domain